MLGVGLSPLHPVRVVLAGFSCPDFYKQTKTASATLTANIAQCNAECIFLSNIFIFFFHFDFTPPKYREGVFYLTSLCKNVKLFSQSLRGSDC